ncbi:oxidoreductase [Klebsiella aerogenes]|uniref:oxidoreductase n=1 Tax=Klebsiella TaxID=570 RepID=UPI00227BBE9E|nr:MULTISPECIES: oxidoreductase [Klebsiella]MCY4740893.1 SDR family NAD(P)-dependent oxidoreductase [Klebsiella pneumoniae]MDQ9319967.1 oxidoreductase [Klebsiella aerogenes]HCB2273212.1 SDR family NAD(P)-dependent oxidoreductase [Citrobacter koseri]HEN5012596.1 SDR family NAD(P)-dependent oxidoreductase [Klebsiella pneumoniae]
MKTWMVTGSSRGFGRALCEAILDSGDNVVATARNPADLAPLLEKFDASRVLAIELDVTDESAAYRAVDHAINTFGKIDVLVNNAGYGDIGSVEDTPLAAFRQQIETNLFGTIIMTKAVIPHMRERRSGYLVQFSSVGGRIGAPGRAAYSAAKWGVEGFSESLAREMRLIGVHVTIVEPGGFRTDFAGTSTTLDPGQLDYDAVVGSAARMQREYNGRQPGDPRRGAAAILQAVVAETPPLRLVLGSDAVRVIEQADHERRVEFEEWKEVSVSTDFPD